jgi:DNA repair protein RecO (recombination protein O)
MPLTIDEGICLRVWDWSETSQTAAIFARQTGLVRCVAKGSKRPGSRFSGGIEPMMRAELSVSIKRGEQLSTLTTWDILEVFPAARHSLRAFHAGMTMLDAVAHCLQPLDPHTGLYDALLAALRELGNPDGPEAGLLRVLWACLDQTGHRLELERDAATGQPLASSPTYGFSPRLGGIIGVETVVSGPVWRVRAQTLEVLRQVATGRRANSTPESTERAIRLLAQAYREVFGVDPPTFARLIGD